MNTLDTQKVIVFMDPELDAEQDKAVQWALEFNGPSISDADAEKLHWHLYCCAELDSHERYGKPQTPERVRKVIVTKSFADRWSRNPDHYRDYWGAREVEIK